LTSPFADVFKGIRVLDLSRAMSGPFAASMLAELGAEIIKVEQPGTGDEIRGFPPHFDGVSGYYTQLNHSRKSIVVDLKKPEGIAIIRRLAGESDVVLENFVPGVGDRLGIGYRQLSEVNPRLVYCSISGFGQDGPFSRKKAYDSLIQAMGGVMALTGDMDGPPVKAGMPVADVGSAMFAAFAIASGLFNRERTGMGQHVDVAMLDTVLSMLSVYNSEYLNTGKIPQRMGTKHRYRVPSGIFVCKDNTMLHVTMGDRQWVEFCEIVNKPDWLSDPAFASGAARVEHRERVEREVTALLRAHTAQEWYEILDAKGVPCGPVNTFAEVYSHPQIKHREIVATVDHPYGAKPIRVVRMPFRFNGKPSGVRSPAPKLGEQTAEVLSQVCGYSESEIAQFMKSGIVAEETSK